MHHSQANSVYYDDKGIACEDWHIAQLTEFIDIPEDYLTFLEKKVSQGTGDSSNRGIAAEAGFGKGCVILCYHWDPIFPF